MTDDSQPSEPKRKYRHPIYQVKLAPEELETFETILGQYLSEVQDPSVTDRFALVRVALFETRLRLAIENSDPADVIDVHSKLLHRELESLKVTRKTKDPRQSKGNTPAEFAAAIMKEVDARRAGIAAPVVEGRLIEAPASGPDVGLSGVDDWSKPKKGRPKKEPLAVAPKPQAEQDDLASFFDEVD
jgi:hypothetical protein